MIQSEFREACASLDTDIKVIEKEEINRDRDFGKRSISLVVPQDKL